MTRPSWWLMPQWRYQSKRLSGRSCWLWVIFFWKNHRMHHLRRYIAEYDLGTCAFEIRQPMCVSTIGWQVMPLRRPPHRAKGLALCGVFSGSCRSHQRMTRLSNFPIASQYLCATGTAPLQGSQHPALRSRLLNQVKASCHHKIPQMKHSCLKPAPFNSHSHSTLLVRVICCWPCSPNIPLRLALNFTSLVASSSLTSLEGEPVKNGRCNIL